ncbi:MAG: NADH-quinone oxidoreductase subunit NuoG [Actinobacteria bacterium]|nr:MAG: NADH-quinone oxidoreductase subunit NuoG [Actinomycetota bacterium]
MPRPFHRDITFSIDGREVTAPENTILVDAAKYGDVEIPVFCYEPKLGQPVGACRMCLVEIEGIPKLQTACSTPVKDGMVVHTLTDRVKEAQNAVVEFLLINHPLDCPVCDKGGECPLQDISFGWGAGVSRFIEPKRHFEKPLSLSPLVAIDRERCILCYRCVRFSQEVAEDYQLVFEERGAHTYVSTFNGHPYVAPFSGNIIELCPVGALTSKPYRFRARPWDIEQAGSVCTLCPSQCNVSFTVRDDRVLRVLARDHKEVDDGWLCDKGRFAYQAIHADERITRPMIRDGGELREVSWDRALDEAAAALGRARGKVAAVVGGQTSNEEGHLLSHLVRDVLGSSDVESRVAGAPSAELRVALDHPDLQATVPDIEFAHAVLVIDAEPVDDMPIIDLRIRKGVRRNHVKLGVATSRPSSLDPNASAVARFAPGAGEAFLAALNAALGGGGVLSELAEAAGTTEQAVRDVAALFDATDLVILYGERLLSGPRADQTARALLNVAGKSFERGRDGAGLMEIPAGTNSRGLREVGCVSDRSPAEIAEAAAGGDLTALYLLHTDPLVDLAGEWEPALDRATTVIAHSMFLTPGIAEHATIVFPAESWAEREGTVTHPDGRLQRLRAGIGRPGDVRACWQTLAELSKRLGADISILTGSMATAQMAEHVPIYAGITHDELGGQGVRWQERDAASAYPGDVDFGPFGLEAPPVRPRPSGSELQFATFRSIWGGPEVAASPALQFLRSRPRVLLSPADAQRLELFDGLAATVAPDGREAVEATVHVRDAVPEGSAFLESDVAGVVGTAGIRKAEAAVVV